MAPLTAATSLSKKPFIRGVNLGSTFLPENWMVPSFYEGTGATTLCTLVRANPVEAAVRVRRHLETFVTERDFAWLAAQGFNAVRVPLGYWNALGPMGRIPYVPVDPADSFAVLDRYFAWGLKWGLDVMLDLHGAPGSQNGADHSGCDSDGIGWGDEATVGITLTAISTLASRYGAHPAFLGIELLNEPAWVVEWSHGGLLDFYTRAERLVRAASPDALVVFNVLFWSDFPQGFGDWWSGQFGGRNVVLDLHLYDCYGNSSMRTLAEHAAQAELWHAAIDDFHTRGHRVLVGEWSLAMGIHEGGQAWADAQLHAFSSTIGWFFWSYKLDGEHDGGDTWSARGVIGSGIRLDGPGGRTSANAAAPTLLPRAEDHGNNVYSYALSAGGLLLAVAAMLILGRVHWRTRGRPERGECQSLADDSSSATRTTTEYRRMMSEA